MMINVPIIVLASGFSKRMGRDKLIIPIEGKLVIEYLFDAIKLSDLKQVLVITNNSVIGALAERFEFLTTENPDADKGQSYAVKIGVEHFSDAIGFIFVAGDMPLMRADILDGFRNQILADPEHIWRCAYKKTMGMPVYFPAYLRDELLHVSGDEGARSVIGKHKELLRVYEVDTPECLKDVDTPEDLAEVADIIKESAK